MTTHTLVTIARSDVVGSLLRPAYLLEVRQGVREGRVSAAELRAAEDRAVREAIALPEAAGNPLTPEQQEAKLQRVAQVARRVWGT